MGDALVVLADGDDAPVGSRAVDQGDTGGRSTEDNGLIGSATGENLEGCVGARGDVEDVAGLRVVCRDLDSSIGVGQ